jgi:hypothetical protein
MRIEFRVLRRLCTALPKLAIALICVSFIDATASDLQFVGDVDYAINGDLAWVFADGYANNGPNGQSGPVRMELWAFTSPYPASLQSGHKLAQYPLPTVATGWAFSELDLPPTQYTPPPDGTWIVSLLLTELTSGVLVNDSYVPRDARNFAKPLAVGPVLPPALTPQIGLWWNPDEPGSGYALDYKHGVLVVTVYSYTAAGAAQWYLASGALSGTAFSATLDKYTGGQCIACTPAVKPALVGNDGIITITFTSPTSATVSLPGGRITQIQPQAF